ncbi:MAG: hypothetical protein B7Z55_04225 [Planctomycetales bacterium 12-60-4]|nr:MAG: hypothetical protein B7Z55_04225 [Planctomycetales bacterium 12-60-4]
MPKRINHSAFNWTHLDLQRRVQSLNCCENATFAGDASSGGMNAGAGGPHPGECIMSLRALICAGQPHVARAMALHLLRADVEVWTVSDSEQAQDRLEHLHPDLLLVDVDMPEMTGWDVVAAARPHGVSGEPHIVALSSRSAHDIDKELHARHLTVDEVLPSPFSPCQLRDRIAAWGQTAAAVK